MKASELRIGNYLIVPGIDRIVQVRLVCLSHFSCVDKDGIVLEESVRINYQPIPLTQELLLKFGFGKIDDFDVYSNIWRINGFMVSFGDYINIHLDWADDEVGFHSIMCYEELFVHQLQNLYFALTGEELILNA